MGDDGGFFGNGKITVRQNNPFIFVNFLHTQLSAIFNVWMYLCTFAIYAYNIKVHTQYAWYYVVFFYFAMEMPVQKLNAKIGKFKF